MLGAVLVSSLFWLVGCGQGTYRIPAVEPVVKPKPENDLLEDIEGGDEKAPASTESKPSTSAQPAEKAPESKPATPESKPEDTKAADTKPADTKPADDTGKSAPKAAPKTKADAKAGAGKSGKPAKK